MQITFFMILTGLSIVALFSAMIMSAISTEALRSGDDKKGEKFALYSSLATGFAAFGLVGMILFYYYWLHGGRKMVNTWTAEPGPNLT